LGSATPAKAQDYSLRARLGLNLNQPDLRQLVQLDPPVLAREHVETAYQFNDTAIGALLGLCAASTSGGEVYDRIVGGSLPAPIVSKGEPATESFPDNIALHNRASTSSSVDETSFDVADSDNVRSGVQLRVGLPLNSCVAELVKPQAANPKTQMKKKNKKRKYSIRNKNRAADLQSHEADDSMLLI
jgi:hypothetical protein